MRRHSLNRSAAIIELLRGISVQGKRCKLICEGRDYEGAAHAMKLLEGKVSNEPPFYLTIIGLEALSRLPGIPATELLKRAAEQTKVLIVETAHAAGPNHNYWTPAGLAKTFEDQTLKLIRVVRPALTGSKQIALLRWPDGSEPFRKLEPSGVLSS